MLEICLGEYGAWKNSPMGGYRVSLASVVGNVMVKCLIYTYGSLLSDRFRYRSLLQTLIKMIEMFFLSALVIPRFLVDLKDFRVISKVTSCQSVQPYVTVNVSLWCFLSIGKCNSGRL